jgi:hypothetical protein
MIAVDFLELARAGSIAPDSPTTIQRGCRVTASPSSWTLKSLIRAAESEIFDRSHRTTGGEEPHRDIEWKLGHHRVHDLAAVLYAHLTHPKTGGGRPPGRAQTTGCEA